LGKGLGIKIRVGIAKGFSGGMLKVLPIYECNGTFDEGLGWHRFPLKKITPPGPCGVSDGEQILV
jgi:hypothetical protein